MSRIPLALPDDHMASYSTVTVSPDGKDWQVRTQPSSTSSGVNALLARILTVPSLRKAMQVAQLPASQENGGRRPPRRAVSSSVSPGWYDTTVFLPPRITVTSSGTDVSVPVP